MHSLPNLLLYAVLCSSFLHLSSAAPAAACVVSYYVTTILVSATTDQTLGPTFTTAADIIATTYDSLATTSADQPASSSTFPTLPANGGLCHHPVYLYPC